MSRLAVDEFVASCDHDLELSDYETGVVRWCRGCGDHGVLHSLQELLLAHRVAPEKVVAVSGIGCSSRLPHYLRTYGFHGIHGRALPISLGVKLGRPDLTVITVMGDGDCFSIGAGHWLHTVHYNPDLLVIVLDNGIYALTKNQASPTTPQGQTTTNTPRGAQLEALNPLSVILSIANVSFLAQTATWHPPHLGATLERAWQHRGMSFVRILQRCPVYAPDFGQNHSGMGWAFLSHVDGVPVDRDTVPANQLAEHDPNDIEAALLLARRPGAVPLGLIYHDTAVPTYGDVRQAHLPELQPDQVVEQLDQVLDTYAVELPA